MAYHEMKLFKTKENMDNWIKKNKASYSYREIFVNNAYCLEVVKLIKM